MFRYWCNLTLLITFLKYCPCLWHNAVFWCACKINDILYFSEVAEPNVEEGEIIAEGSRDEYDVTKIISYPGFNVPCSEDIADASICSLIYFDSSKHM